MANGLEQLLQPGERILYHPGKSWLCNGTVPYVVANVFCIAVLAAAGLVTFDQPGLVAVASVVLSFLGFTLWGYPRNAPSDAMVTDRRLIQKCGLFNSRLIEIEAAAVKHVAADPDRLLVSVWKSEFVEIRHPNTAFGLGIALAYAADAPHPRLPQRHETHIDNLWLTCVVFTAISLGVFLLKWLFVSYGTVIFSYSLVLGVGAFVLGGILANLAGVILGGLLCAVLTRPFLTYDELRLWIDNSPIFWPYLDGGDKDYCVKHMHCWYADWLYLRPYADSEQQR